MEVSVVPGPPRPPLYEVDAGEDPPVVHLLPFLLFLEGQDRAQPGRAEGGASPCSSRQVRTLSQSSLMA